jgi:hypothetical protein
MTTDTTSSTLYVHSIQIFQNIQDMLNVKKNPSNEDILFSCTDIHDHDCVSTSDYIGNEVNLDVKRSESHIELLAHYVNDLTKDSSTFDSNVCE